MHDPDELAASLARCTAQLEHLGLSPTAAIRVLAIEYGIRTQCLTDILDAEKEEQS